MPPCPVDYAHFTDEETEAQACKVPKRDGLGQNRARIQRGMLLTPEVLRSESQRQEGGAMSLGQEQGDRLGWNRGTEGQGDRALPQRGSEGLTSTKTKQGMMEKLRFR